MQTWPNDIASRYVAAIGQYLKSIPAFHKYRYSLIGRSVDGRAYISGIVMLNNRMTAVGASNLYKNAKCDDFKFDGSHLKLQLYKGHWGSDNDPNRRLNNQDSLIQGPFIDDDKSKPAKEPPEKKQKQQPVEKLDDIQLANEIQAIEEIQQEWMAVIPDLARHSHPTFLRLKEFSIQQIEFMKSIYSSEKLS